MFCPHCILAALTGLFVGPLWFLLLPAAILVTDMKYRIAQARRTHFTHHALWAMLRRRNRPA